MIVHAGAVDLVEPGVDERLERRRDVVGQAQLVDDAAMQTRRHAVVDDAAERDQRRKIRVGLGEGAEQHLHVGLAALARHVDEARRLLRLGRRHHLERRARRQCAHGARHDAHDGVALHRARDGEHHVARAVVGGEVAAHVGGVEPLDVLVGPGDAIAERMIGPDGEARDVVDVDQPPVLVVVLVHLLEDDAALDVDVGKRRRGEDLGEQLEPLDQRLGMQRNLVQ